MGANKKTHKRAFGADCRSLGQTEFEYTHTALCGYVRENVTFNDDDVTCKLCLRELTTPKAVNDENY